MALTLINLSGFQRGVASDELGINIESFSVEVSPEVNEWLPGKTGEARGKAISAIPQGKLTFNGEISDISAGIGAATFGTAFVPVNTTAYLGRSAGGWYLNTVTVGQDRSGWKTISAEAESRSLVP